MRVVDVDEQRSATVPSKGLRAPVESASRNARTWRALIDPERNRSGACCSARSTRGPRRPTEYLCCCAPRARRARHPQALTHPVASQSTAAGWRSSLGEKCLLTTFRAPCCSYLCFGAWLSSSSQQPATARYLRRRLTELASLGTIQTSPMETRLRTNYPRSRWWHSNSQRPLRSPSVRARL